MLDTHFIRGIELLKNKIEDSTKYPFSLPVVTQLTALSFHPNVTFVIGENGTGKSTLLEAIAVHYGFNAEGGSRNFNFSTQTTHSNLHQHIRLSKGVKKRQDGYFLRAESFYNVASTIDELDKEPSNAPRIIDSYGGTSLHEQSHGESFFSLLMNRFGGHGMYILDEPEAALSPQKQLILLKRFDELVQQESQFIIATHSPILLSYPNAKIIQISKNGYEEKKYQETDHYTVYQHFLTNPDSMLKELGIEQRE